MRMYSVTKTAFAALLLGSTIVTAAALAATPDTTGCPPGMHRAESEGSGVGTIQQTAARKAESEGSGVGSVNLSSRKAESEGSGVGTVQQTASRKAESEGSGVGSVQQTAAAAPCIK